MHVVPVRLVLIFSLLLLTACASKQPRTEVTRFHMNAPIAAESIVVKSAATGPASLQYLTYIRYVSDELAKLGFTPVSENSNSDDSASESTADLVAEVVVTRGMQPPTPKKSGMSVGIGGGSLGSKVGIGGGVSFPIGRSSKEVSVTELKVTMVRRSAEAVVWEGSARRESRDTPISPSTAMKELAAALFAGFPGESGRTVVDTKDQQE